MVSAINAPHLAHKESCRYNKPYWTWNSLNELLCKFLKNHSQGSTHRSVRVCTAPPSLRTILFWELLSRSYFHAWRFSSSEFKRWTSSFSSSCFNFRMQSTTSSFENIPCLFLIYKYKLAIITSIQVYITAYNLLISALSSFIIPWMKLVNHNKIFIFLTLESQKFWKVLLFGGLPWF